MTELEKIFQESREHLDDAIALAKQLGTELTSAGVNAGLATMAMGLGFSAGAVSVGMPLSVALDLVRNVYAQNQDKLKAH